MPESCQPVPSLIQKSCVCPNGGEVGPAGPGCHWPLSLKWKAPLPKTGSLWPQNVIVASKLPLLLKANHSHSPPSPTICVQNVALLLSQLSEIAAWYCTVLP